MKPPSITYGAYLALDDLLACQRPLSLRHDEMLFVVIHQTKELWLKQIVHEVALAQRLIRAGDVEPALKCLARVSRIQAVMTLSWDVLATMTPADYQSFRGRLGSSSGFQSWQFRQLEFMLGLKDPAFLSHHEAGGAGRAALEAALAAPSLYEDAIARLAAAGFAVPAGAAGGAAVEEAWLQVYRDPDRFLGPLRTGGKAGGRGRRPADLAPQARPDGGADHRAQARHGRHRGRRLPADHAGAAVLPGAVVRADAPLVFAARQYAERRFHVD
ncbi:MAG: tryptophan 2,3-dioxygenase family protein [Hyphomonadaceae bacterium]|nr:tryptophan 2,3-dioxygenase family protein [Hyphomonadaceae bacterium]